MMMEWCGSPMTMPPRKKWAWLFLGQVCLMHRGSPCNRSTNSRITKYPSSITFACMTFILFPSHIILSTTKSVLRPCESIVGVGDGAAMSLLPLYQARGVVAVRCLVCGWDISSYFCRKLECGNKIYIIRIYTHFWELIPDSECGNDYLSGKWSDFGCETESDKLLLFWLSEISSHKNKICFHKKI